MVLRVVSELPYPGVGLAPALRDAISEPRDGPPHLGGQVLTGVRGKPRGVDDPAIPIELMLMGSAVADPNGLAVSVARPSVERAFGAWMLSVQGEKHREARAVEEEE